MKCQKLGKMCVVAKKTKQQQKNVDGDESPFSFIRFHLAKVSHAIVDKQTKELTFKQGTFLIGLLSIGERGHSSASLPRGSTSCFSSLTK